MLDGDRRVGDTVERLLKQVPPAIFGGVRILLSHENPLRLDVTRKD